MSLSLGGASRSRRALAAVSAVLAGGALVTGCASMTHVTQSAAQAGRSTPSSTPSPHSAVVIGGNVRPGSDQVKPSTLVQVTARKGTLRTVRVTDAHGHTLRGSLSSDKTSWTASERLAQGQRYKVVTTAVDDAGLTRTSRSHFRAEKLTLAQQTYPSLYPLGGQTVGVGMPVMVHFDVPVTNRKNFEKHMHVTTSSGQKGSWYWVDSQDAHFRPHHYWKPFQKVTVNLDLGGLAAGNGIYGQLSKRAVFDIGRSQVSQVNIATDQLHVYRAGRLIRTIPVTTGMQPDFTTRSGTKIIVEKLLHTRMNSETIGINPHSSQGYDLNDVRYAMRLTYSGEFLHAAPWSVASQGHANVSHGCTGMSTSNAAWLYDNSMVGDVVNYVGSNKPMTLTNGYGDWNLPWSQWKAGSAL